MATVPKIVSDFSTQLSVAIAVGGTTGTLSLNVDDDGVALPTGLYYFTIDGQNSSKEHISCTNTGGSLTNIKSVSRQGVETSGAARAHRVGATVVMTDFATYKNYIDATVTGGASDASQSTKGIVKLSAASAGDPIAVAIEDVRLPSANPTTLFAPIGLTPGVISPYIGRTAPTGYLLCDGSAVSRTTYASLLAVIAPSQTFTVSLANPAVFTATAHGLITGDQVHLTTTGGLYSGLATNTNYYVIYNDVNSFWLSDTQAHAIAGTNKVVTTGTQSGTHTIYASNYGKGDGSTTFNVPDFRGLTLYGLKTSDANFAVLNTGGTNVGEKTHQLIVAELASHSHNIEVYQGGGGSNVAKYGNNSDLGALSTATAGSDTPHNNMPPYAVTNYIIKT